MTTSTFPAPNLQLGLDDIVTWVSQLLPRRSRSVASLPSDYLAVLQAASIVLDANDLADLHASLERAIEPVLKSCADISAKDHVTGGVTSLPEPEAPDENDPIAAIVGLGCAAKLNHSICELLRIHNVGFGSLLADLKTGPSEPRDTLLRSTAKCWPGALHRGVVVPHRLLESTLTQLKGFIALLAIEAASIQSSKLEPWLAKALCDSMEDGVKELAWFFSSLGYPSGVELRREPADFAVLFKEAEEADAAFLRRMDDDIRNGKVGIPEV